MVSNKRFLCFDNVDASPPYFNDRLAIVSTGGAISKRKLYTTNELIEFQTNTFVGVTTRTPHFRRDDIADRLLIMKLEPISQRRPEAELIEEIAEKRSVIWRQLIHECQKILREIPNVQNYISNSRMADYEKFCRISSMALGYSELFTSGEAFKDMFKRLIATQTDFTVEFDVVLELLRKWIDSNQGKTVSNNQLFKELRNLSLFSGDKFPIQSEKSFCQKIRLYREKLEDEYRIEEVHLSSGQTAWRYYSKLRDTNLMGNI